MDKFADGTTSVISVLIPKGPGWEEVPIDQRFSMGYPIRAFIHSDSMLAVLSAIEVVPDEEKGPEYHLSVSKQHRMGISRCDSNEARWVLEQFELAGAEEDNHVPSGLVRNFWRPVSEPLVGMECPCKETEPVIREDKGDFIWRPAPE